MLRAAALLLVLAVMVALPGSAKADGPRWRWPLPPPHTVISPFQAPEHRYGPGHRGIDIAVPAEGAEVRAVAAGTVRFSGVVAGRGVVSVTHADGLISTYEPVHGVLEEGASVEAGEVLGTLADASGSSHCPGSTCLHLGARRGTGYLDPLLLLGAHGPSVLLPWDEPSTGPGPAAAAGSVPPPAGDPLSTAAARAMDSALAAAVPPTSLPLR
ncbi:murein hydrolase activator EnvC family protein [Brachybacterium vulturis]|uniref:murein hydrolase activator EnvC family protein n=1 Tax=Brachybacterium vulturis TaxID=2017484 RepID=UPI001FE94959|nr:M23 family metallopeptidase [Brachybacterium vulturis]